MGFQVGEVIQYFMDFYCDFPGCVNSESIESGEVYPTESDFSFSAENVGFSEYYGVGLICDAHSEEEINALIDIIIPQKA